MAAGAVVVSTRHAGIPEAIESGHNGLLVAEGDLDGYAEAIAHVVGDPVAVERMATQRAGILWNVLMLDCSSAGLKRLSSLAYETMLAMKKLIKKIPLLRTLARFLYFSLVAKCRAFQDSESYWRARYRSGGNSGAGSYHKLAGFKAEVLNEFVRKHAVRTVIEYGCGDGEQLQLVQYPTYLGFDVSEDVVALCRDRFTGDDGKAFRLMREYAGETAELTLSLDVVYHLVEDDVFAAYMHRLFDSSTCYVIIYSSDTELQERWQLPHVRHRKFTEWVVWEKPGWHLIRHIPNRHPYSGDDQKGSFADFFIYERQCSTNETG